MRGTKRKRRKKRGDLRAVRQRRLAGLQNAGAIEEDVRTEAYERGLVLLVSRGQTAHWMYERSDTQSRVMEYWPATGTVWCPSTGEKWKAADAWEALELATARRDV